jgi:hypothetical protein
MTTGCIDFLFFLLDLTNLLLFVRSVRVKGYECFWQRPTRLWWQRRKIGKQGYTTKRNPLLDASTPALGCSSCPVYRASPIQIFSDNLELGKCTPPTRKLSLVFLSTFLNVTTVLPSSFPPVLLQSVRDPQ